MSATAAHKLVPATLEIPIVVEPGEGGFYAYSQYLPGMHIDGPTAAETLARAKRAAAQYLISLVTHRDPLPAPTEDVELAEGAVVHKVTLEWPTAQTSGTK